MEPRTPVVAPTAQVTDRGPVEAQVPAKAARLLEAFGVLLMASETLRTRLCSLVKDQIVDKLRTYQIISISISEPQLLHRSRETIGVPD